MVSTPSNPLSYIFTYLPRLVDGALVGVVQEHAGFPALGEGTALEPVFFEGGFALGIG